MKKFLIVFVMFSFLFSAFGGLVEAKSRSYYKSAKTGRFTTKSYSNSHKSTTYKSNFR